MPLPFFDRKSLFMRALRSFWYFTRLIPCNVLLDTKNGHPGKPACPLQKLYRFDLFGRFLYLLRQIFVPLYCSFNSLIYSRTSLLRWVSLRAWPSNLSGS